MIKNFIFLFQILADEWQPFIPSFMHDQQFQNYPRSDTVRQFFGKNVEAVHNSLKKSFQASTANNVDRYAVPPAIGSFNSYALQTVQARNPILDKNIKDGQFLDQSSQFPSKYHSPSVQQTMHRFPTYAPPIPQYQSPNNQYHQPVNQYQHFQNNNQFINRLETPIKPTTLLQSPSRTISTSVQVFPPNQQNQYPSNTYFLGIPSKTENFVEEDPLARKQNRPNEFLMNNNNIATIYGSKDPALNIPPPALKSTPFTRNEPVQNNFIFENIKPPSDRYEIANNYHKLAFNEVQPVKHVVETNPKLVEETNPSKQVFEQLSHFGRPFSLPRETATEYNRIKPEKNTELEGLIHSYNAPLRHYKKEKVKSNPQQYSYSNNNVGRYQTNNVYENSVPSAPANQIVDYEPGKLQSVKTVTYVPQKDILQFNEEDVSSNINHYQFGELTKSPFLPTPTESNDDTGGFIHYERYTTPAYEISSKLPQNHKYSNQYQTTTRTRHHPANEFLSNKYSVQSTESNINSQFLDDQIRQLSSTTQNYENEYTEMTTRKVLNRRRKPSKTKNKEYNRNKGNNVYTDTSTQSANNFYVSDVPNTESTSVPQQYIARKRVQTKYTTTTEAEEDNYPNYPAHFLKQLNKQYQQDQYNPIQKPYESEDVNYFNSEKEIGKENYPVFSTQGTTTKTPEITTVTLKRIKNKYANSTRPRFSIKDYKRTTTVTPLTTASSIIDINTDYQIELEKKNNRKNLFVSRMKNKTETSSTEKEETASEPSRKYKPRIKAPKFRTTSTTAIPETTSERVNTFKPSTVNRYRSTPSKYYNRFRTTTEITNNEADDTVTSSSDKKPIKTMLYSAKRSSILRPKSTTTPKVEDDFEDDEYENIAEGSTNVVAVKKNLYRIKTAPKLEKVDDVSETSIMTSSEEQEEKNKLKNKTTDTVVEEQSAITQLTSSEEEFDVDNNEEEEEIDEIVSAVKENEVTTESANNSSTTIAVADDRNDDAEKVSQVSSLTSIDESNLPISFYRKWSSNGNQNE